MNVFKMNWRGVEFNLAETPFNCHWVPQHSKNSYESEPLTMDVLFKYSSVKPNTLVSSGAGTGATFEIMAGKMYDKVYGLEPDPYSFNEFKENIKANDYTNVFIEHGALYDGSVDSLEVYPDSNTGYGGTKTGVGSNASISVPATTLRKFFDKHQIQKGALLMLDMEGAENVLFDDTDFFKTYKPIILLEIHWQFMTGDQMERMKRGLSKLTDLYDGIELDKYQCKNERALNTVFIPK